MASANGSGRLTPRQLKIEEGKRQAQADRLARKSKRRKATTSPQPSEAQQNA